MMRFHFSSLSSRKLLSVCCERVSQREDDSPGSTPPICLNCAQYISAVLIKSFILTQPYTDQECKPPASTRDDGNELISDKDAEAATMRYGTISQPLIDMGPTLFQGLQQALIISADNHLFMTVASIHCFSNHCLLNRCVSPKAAIINPAPKQVQNRSWVPTRAFRPSLKKP